MVLSHITETRSPFYHASGLFHSVVSTNIGKNVRIPLRFVAEAWSFSEKYGSRNNLLTWAKVAIQARIPKLFFLDSLVLNLGDLWRQKQGEGLILDYFEAQGGEAKFYRNKFFFSARALGYGLTGSDDIATFSIGYDSALSINHFLNYFIPDPILHNINISSICAYSKVNENFHIYQEAAINLRTHDKGFLGGFLVKYLKKKNFIDARIEFRFYDKDFYSDQEFNSPYFESLTALDKPVNQYYTYLVRDSISRVFAGRIKGRWFPFDGFFIDADLEP